MGTFTKLKAKIGTDDTLAREGAWLVLDEAAGIRWKIRSAHTREAQKAQHEIALRVAESSPSGTDFDSALASDHEMLGFLVADWAGMTGDDGAAVACTPEQVAAALDAFPEWRPRVLAFARNPKNHRLPSERLVAALAGN